MIKILYVTNIPSPYKVDFFNELGKKCDLTVLYERDEAKDRDQKWKDYSVRNFLEIFLKGKKIGNDTAICLSVVKYIRDKSYDLIVVGGYSSPTGMLAIKYMNLKRIPFILSVDGGLVKNDSLIKYKLKKYFISNAKACLSTGEKTNEYLIHYGAKKDNIHKYPFTSIRESDILNKVIDHNYKNMLKKELNIKQEKVIITVGRSIHRKGYDVLIKASKALSDDVGVYIVGGEPTEYYLKLIKELNLNNIYFIDFKNKEDLKKYYLAADIFVLPTREDVWGLVINEAMSLGLPVITTDKCVAGVELINNRENGFIIPVEDEYKLEEKITELLNDEELCKIIGDNNLKKITQYTIENMAKIHTEIFRSLMNG